jgi:hypothetical protein
MPMRGIEKMPTVAAMQDASVRTLESVTDGTSEQAEWDLIPQVTLRHSDACSTATGNESFDTVVVSPTPTRTRKTSLLSRS